MGRVRPAEDLNYPGSDTDASLHGPHRYYYAIAIFPEGCGVIMVNGSKKWRMRFRNSAQNPRDVDLPLSRSWISVMA